VKQLASKRQLLRLALAERTNPDPYYAALADVTIAELGVPHQGRLVLDLGCGTGWDAAALRTSGARVIAVDIEEDLARTAKHRGTPSLAADGLRLPFGDATFDGVYSSNIVEHVPSVERLLDEIARVTKPGGWSWVSWTNWYSPWGGHHMTPFHLLGPRLGTWVYYRLFGPPPKNVPGEGLFPTYVGRTLDLARHHPHLVLEDALPRYYPSMRWLLRVPGLREFATWNCVMVLRRTD
jgi:SAM-dependent methyltransferase